jgi:serine/threonine-protein kinase RsbW
MNLTTTTGPNALRDVLRFVESACAELKIAGSDAFAVRLAAEEICTNIIDYGYGDVSGPLAITIERSNGQAIITIHDRGRSFAPENAPAPDLTSDAEDRQIGGLGIHLVRQMMDSVEYSTAGNAGNTMRLVKKLTMED